MPVTGGDPVCRTGAGRVPLRTEGQPGVSGTNAGLRGGNASIPAGTGGGIPVSIAGNRRNVPPGFGGGAASEDPERYGAGVLEIASLPWLCKRESM